MPQVTRPHPLGLAALDQVPKDGINLIAHSAQHSTPTVGRGMLGAAKGRDQADTLAAQDILELGQPGVAIPQEQTLTAIGQIEGHVAFMEVAWG